MSRRRDRGFLLETLPLGKSSLYRPITAPTAYVHIARTLEQLDRVMLDEIQNDIRRCLTPAEDSSQPPVSTSPFSNVGAHDESDSYVQDIKKGTSHTTSETDTFAYLSDTKCVTTWSRVHYAVLKSQGDSLRSSDVSWTQAKARANEILSLAQAVLEIYEDDDCQNLRIPGREIIGASIEAKLRALHLFDAIYSRPTNLEENRHTIPNSHEFIRSFDRFLVGRKEKTKAGRKERYVRMHRNLIFGPRTKRDVILVTATVFVIAISAIPLGLAIHTSTNNAPGSISDADFWLLIQSSLMQLLGLVTTSLISFMPNSRKQHLLVLPVYFTWTVAFLGLGCAVSAPILYVRIRIMYGALVSFMASAAQACMVLQLALFVDVGESEKMD